MPRRPSAVVLGGSGLVGSRIVELWGAEVDVIAPSHADLDLLDRTALVAFLSDVSAEVVINTAGWADVDGAEGQRGDHDGPAFKLNAALPGALAALCHERSLHLVHVSTDYVFDGTCAERAYREDDAPHPLGWYAETKLIGEQAALAEGGQVSVARIEMPFRATFAPKRDLARIVAHRLRAGQAFAGVVDQRITPVFLDDAVRAFRKLADSRYAGVIHIASSDWTTPFAYARGVATRLGLDTDLVRAETLASFARTRAARRPQHSWLDVSRFEGVFGRDVLRPVDHGLDEWAAQVLARAGRG